MLSPHTMSYSLWWLLYSPFPRLYRENCVTLLCAEHISHFLLEKGQANASRDTTKSKCLHQPKFLILSVILAAAWFSKNVQVLSIRISKNLKNQMPDCYLRLLFLIAPFHFTLFGVWHSLFFKLSHLFLTVSRTYTVANAKAFSWPYR